MSGRKVQKHCRIFQWVEEKDGELASAIRDLCMEGALSGGRRAGATFLFPSDSVRERIVADAYSSEPESAVKLLDAHIIPSAVRSAAEFRKGVGSRLNIKLEVGSAKGDTVTLKNGATLALAKDFQPLGKDNIAVWKVTSGEVPLEGEEFAPPDRRARRNVKGGDPNAESVLPGALGSRAQLATEVEAAYDTCQHRDRCRADDPYLAHVVSLLNFLKMNDPGLFAAVMPIVDRDPVTTFYLLIEPYKTSGKYLIRDDVLFGPKGWNAVQIYEGAVTEFRDFFNQQPAGDAAPWAYRNPASVRAAIDTARLELLGPDGRNANKVSLPKGVRARYETLISKNTIGGLQQVLPDSTIALVGDPLKKLWQDELRFIVHQAMQSVRSMPVYTTDAFAEVVRMLRFARPGNNYGKEAALSDGEALKANVAPQAEFALLVKWVNSSDFLYAPIDEKNIGGSWGDVPVTAGNDAFLNSSSLNVVNTEHTKQRYLESRKDTPRYADAGTLTAMRFYAQRNGESAM